MGREKVEGRRSSKKSTLTPLFEKPRHYHRKNCSQFPQKLWKILENPDKYGRVIKWNPEGDTVCILNKEELPLVLEKYFRGTHLSSIERQFSWYGFKKTNLQYHHPAFRRDNPDCVHTMRRKESGPKNQQAVVPKVRAVSNTQQWAIERTTLIVTRVTMLLCYEDFTDEDGNCVQEPKSTETQLKSLVPCHMERKWSAPRVPDFFDLAKVAQQIRKFGFDNTIQAYHSLNVRHLSDPERATKLVSEFLDERKST